MSFNISDFRAKTNKFKGFSKLANFEVLISKTDLNSVMTSDDLRFFASGITMPGFQFGTDSVMHHGIGYPEARPVSYEINPVVIEFLVDQEQKVYQFFYEWIKRISNFELNPITNQSFVIDPFLFALPEEYANQDIQINQYNDNGKIIREFILHNAYPKTINSFDANWNAVNQIQTLLIEFEYRRWTTKHENEISDAEASIPTPTVNPLRRTE